jgi:hypothetical protein
MTADTIGHGLQGHVWQFGLFDEPFELVTHYSPTADRPVQGGLIHDRP